MTKRDASLYRLAALIAPVALAWIGLRLAKPPVPPDETPTGRAHRLCRVCGLEPDEIDRLILIMRDSPGDRATLTRLWEQTYGDDVEALEESRELCGGCVEAILDAAESKSP